MREGILSRLGPYPLPFYQIYILVKDPETASLLSEQGQIDPARTANCLKEHVKQAQSCTDAIAACVKP